MRTSPLNALAAALCSGLLVIPAAHADFTVLNISIGYLSTENSGERLPVNALCMLVADLDGDGFDPLTNTGWTSGDDVLIRVFDGEHPQPGTKSFSLSSGAGEAGLFSRTLTVDHAQFAPFSQPIAFALRWFPTLTAGLDLEMNLPAAETPYGEFSRAVPIYPPAYGTSGWFIPTAGGDSITPDPYATSELGGVDEVGDGEASRFVAVVPEPSSVSLLLLSGLLLGARRTRGKRMP